MIDLMGKDEKTKSKVESILSNHVHQYKEDVVNADANKKSEELLRKEFFEKINGFDEKALPREYLQTLSQLSSLYGRRTLVEILSFPDSQ
jgi:hypothetical protein